MTNKLSLKDKRKRYVNTLDNIKALFNEIKQYSTT